MPRGRTKTVCSFCRRRRIRCDMASPCGACVRYGNAHCDIPPPKPPAPDVAQLRARLEHLEQALFSAGDDMSFHEQVRTTPYRNLLGLRHLGLFRWLALVSMDTNMFELMQRLWPWTKERIKREREAERTEREGSHEAGDGRGGGQSGDHESYREGFHESRMPLTVVGHSAGDLSALAPQVRAHLPDKKVLWMLVDRYFAAVAPHVPVLDEHTLRRQISNLTGARVLTKEPVHVGTIDLPDVSVWGVLLVVLRLAHLSLYTVSGALKTQCVYSLAEDLEYMAGAKIGPRAVEVAYQCLAYHDLAAETGVDVVQLAALLRVHAMVDPDVGSPDVRNHTFSAILSLLALCRWLNRDPGKVFGDSLGARTCQLFRKIWFVVLDMDYTFASFTGNIPMISRLAHDVVLPQFSPEALNLANARMDAAVCRALNEQVDVRTLLDDTLALSGSVARRVKVAAVEDVLARLRAVSVELMAQDAKYRAEGTPNSVDAFSHSIRFHRLLQLLYVSIAVSTHLYYHYVRRRDFARAQREWLTVVTIICDQLLPHVPLLVDETADAFKGAGDLFTGMHFSHNASYGFLVVFAHYLDYRAHWSRVQNDPLHMLRLALALEYARLFAALERACTSVHTLLTLLTRANNAMLMRYRFHKKVRAMTAKMMAVCEPSFYASCSVLSVHAATVEEHTELSELVERASRAMGSVLLELPSPVPAPGPTVPDAPPDALLDLDYSPFDTNFNWILLEQLFSA